MSRRVTLIIVAVVVVAGGAVAWFVLNNPGLPPGFAGANGRLEAKQVDIATKYQGRIKEVLADEGDTVDAGQIVAKMDTEPLEAELRSDEAKIKEAQDNRRTALAEVAAKQAEFNYSEKQYRRSKELVVRGAVSEQEADVDQAHMEMTRAALLGAQAQAVRTQSAIDAATADAERVKAEIEDSVLKAPIRGRVQNRLAEPGEVLPAGGKVLALVDLSDVYMYVFLPEPVAGKVALGSEARIVLDAAPEYPIKTVVSFVSPKAQFTPKTVETAEERHNLTFRVKLQLDKDRLRQFEPFRESWNSRDGLCSARQRRGLATDAPGEAGSGTTLESYWFDFIRLTDIGMRESVASIDESERGAPGSVASVKQVTQRYGKAVALDDITLDFPAQKMIGLIGPDGVGKSTLLGIIAGVRRLQSGRVEVLGGNIADARFRNTVSSRIAYLPQGLGKNLYPTLSIFENIDFFGRLFGQSREEREWRIKDLLASTDLTPFRDRPAGKLSGGMKQKLGLCCSLIHDPDLLILDEPTTGVDPLARRQFWELIDRVRVRRTSMSVMVATAYMDEAERFDWLAAMNAGKVLATGTSAELKIQTNEKTLEKAFIRLLPEESRRGHKEPVILPMQASGGPPAIEAHDLTQRFGAFTAVDHVSFRIERGEIFGFLGLQWLRQNDHDEDAYRAAAAD